MYSDIQLKIFQDRYAHGEEKTPEEAWKRVAAAVAEQEQSHQRGYWRGAFFELLKDFRYVPGGRIMHAMGTGSSVTAQNCYVIPIEDSRKSIMNALEQWVEIQAKGGGVGINMSPLRPSGDYVKSVQGTASGPVNWAQPFAFISKNVVQQGGSRRGAAMIMLDISHPDIQEFIHAKETPGVLEGCNVSVCISNAFMAAVTNDDDFPLEWGGKVYRSVRARDLWDEICTAAWKSAEPGIYFMERANEQANSAYFETLESTNPCGEQPLGPYGACLLGSFNIAQFMYLTDARGSRLDVVALAGAVATAVRFNDNIVDLSNYPLPECKDSQQRIRRMGIGIMGLADALIMAHIRYGSEDALAFTAQVYKTIRDSAYATSAALAEERGPFPEYTEALLDRPFIKSLPEHIQNTIKVTGLRNCYLLTQAPTGTTSMLAGVNGGIEPYFAFKYMRSDRTGKYEVKSEWSDEYDSADRPDYLVIANDVSPMEHILMQAAAQQYNDSSISKTVNLPESATIEDIKTLYKAAWSYDLKSLSVYRDNSRSEQVLIHVKPEAEVAFVPRVRNPLPDTRNSVTHKAVIDGQKAYLHVGLYDDFTPGELFITMSKEGSTLAGLLNWGATMMSVALQHGVPMEALTEHMVGTQFEPAGMTQDAHIRTTSSPIDYVGRFLNGMFSGIQQLEVPVIPDSAKRGGAICPDCGQQMYAAEGCWKCASCTYSRC